MAESLVATRPALGGASLESSKQEKRGHILRRWEITCLWFQCKIDEQLPPFPHSRRTWPISNQWFQHQRRNEAGRKVTDSQPKQMQQQKKPIDEESNMFRWTKTRDSHCCKSLEIYWALGTSCWRAEINRLLKRLNLRNCTYKKSNTNEEWGLSSKFIWNDAEGNGTNQQTRHIHSLCHGLEMSPTAE